MSGWHLVRRVGAAKVIVCALLLGAGCSDRSGASIALRLNWQEEPPAKAWVWLRVEERTHVTVPGTILSSTGPHLFPQDGASAMEMPKVPLGTSRVLVAEVREGENPGLPIRYYGISGHFDLVAGDDRNIEVPVTLHRPEAEYNAPKLDLLFDDEDRDFATNADLAKATIFTRSANAVSLVIANDVSFIANQQQFVLAGESPLECSVERAEGVDFDVCLLPAWNVKADVEDQGDIGYPVFVKFVDRFGYESRAYVTTVIQDTVPPSMLSASLTLEAGGDSRGATVSAITDGTMVELALSVSEPLREDPAVNANRGDHAVAFGEPTEAGGEGGNTYVFRFEAQGLSQAATAQGEYAVVVEMVDIAGNEAQVEIDLLQPFVVDSIAPAALVPDKQRLVYLYRAPWGADSTGGEPYAELRACPPPEGTDWRGCDSNEKAFGAGSSITVLGAELIIGVPQCTDKTLAAGVTAGTGSLAIEVDPDLVTVCVIETDASGKTSEPFPVTHIEWVATTGGKVAGSIAENPNRYEHRAWFGNALFQDGEPGVKEPPGTNTLVQRGGPSLESVGANRWFDCSAGTEQREVWQFDMAFDAARGRVVRFGGYSRLAETSTTALLSDRTWEWNGYGWRDTLQSGPQARSGHGLSYDMRRGVSVLFGGKGDDGLLGDTWSWDGATWEEHQVQGPSLRTSHAQAYDRHRGRVVVFGGHGEMMLADTWEWDGQAWFKPPLTDPEGDGDPSARHRGTLAYDSQRNVSVLYGGCKDAACSQKLSDTWEYDGKSWKVVSDTGPGARYAHSMTFDENHGEVLLFGGNQSGVKGDTWSFNGEKWTELSKAGPAPRLGHTMIFDHHHGVAVLFGGTVRGWETWEWDQGAWALVGGFEGPHHTEGNLFKYVGEGESLAFVPTYYGNWDYAIWSWNGRTWLPVANIDESTPDVGGPASDGDGAVAYDRQRQRLLMFGGEDSNHELYAEVWEWDGSKWHKVEPLDPEGDGNPIARVGNKLVYAPDRSSILLFGGTDDYNAGSFLSDTWEWNGKSWKLLHKGGVDGPGDRVDMAVAYDEIRETMVVNGGYMGPICESSVWEFDGISWQQHASAMPARDKHQIAYDPVAQTLLMWGGESCPAADCGEGSADACTYLWENDGSGWQVLNTDGPPGRHSFGMTFDAERERLVVCGGVYTPVHGPLWEWDRGAYARPAQVMMTSLAEAVPGTMPTVLEVAAVFEAGGTGLPGGNEEPGIDLLLWMNGRWTTVAQSKAGTASPENLEHHLAQADVVSGIPVGPERRIAYAVAPTAVSGPQPDLAAVAVSYAEVSALFRLPMAVETHCGDALDDDMDGLVDCLDADCWCAGKCGDVPAECCEGTTAVECPGFCQPDCTGKQCGPSGCGGHCGFCPEGHDCLGGQCSVCVPACLELECGADGCGGSCGSCGEGAKCFSGICVQGPCFGITYEGCCDGEMLKYCDNSIVATQDCGESMLHCGWSAADQYYDCGTPGNPDPADVHPMDCPDYR